jgi:mannose-6-phosphate isomerase
MTIEHARTHIMPKPWGVVDLRPWNNAQHDGGAIGEIWFERSGAAVADPRLLLKLLFTNQPLSIQVHPGDAFAQSIGLPNGKTEAWYVLNAAPEAKVALGLNRRLTPQQLRDAVDDGSISEIVVWHPVSSDDVIFVPAGTIHAIGAGLIIAEIQQRSDATFRLFDFDRRRELHVESAIAVANAGPADFCTNPTQLTDARTLLISNEYFAFERIVLAPDSAWCMEAEQETWFLAINGSARIGSFDVATGDAIFAQSDNVEIHAGSMGLVGLVAYAKSGPVPDLLKRLGQPDASDARRPQEVRMPTSLTQATAAPMAGCMEATQ